MHRSLTPFLLAGILLMLATPLFAQGGGPDDLPPNPKDPVPMNPAAAMDPGCPEGRKLFAAGRFAEALPLLDAYIKAGPNTQVVDEIVFMKGRCCFETKQYDGAETALLWILRNCTTSRFVPEAGVQLCRVYIATKNDGALRGLRDEAPTRWGLTSFLGQITEMIFQERIKTDPPKALAEIQEVIVSGRLTPVYLRKCLTLRLTYLETNRPTQYRAEGVALLTKLPDGLTNEDLDIYASLAPKLYKSLATGGRADDAKAVHERIQALAMQAGNPKGLVQQDRDAYWASQPPAIAKPAVLATAEGIKMAGSREAAQMALLAVMRAYGLLIDANRLADAEALHTTTQTRLAALNCADLAEADHMAYAGEWFPAMEKADPARAYAAIRPLCTALQACATPQTLNFLAGLAGRYYRPLFGTGGDADAEAVHAWLRPRLLAAALTPVTPPPKATTAPTDRAEAVAARELAAYTEALQAALWARAIMPEATPDDVVALRTRCLAAWQLDAVATVPTVTTFLRETLPGSPTAEAWLPALQTHLEKLPTTCPGRADAYLAFAKLAHDVALKRQAAVGELGPAAKQAETAYRFLLEQAPSDPAAVQALNGLVALAQAMDDGAAVEALVAKLGKAPAAQPVREWLAGWWFAKETADDYARAEAAYGDLLAKAGKAEEKAPVWQFRRARCLEGCGKTPEALAAYQRVIDVYPASPCIVAALAKIAQLQQGGK